MHSNEWPQKLKIASQPMVLVSQKKHSYETGMRKKEAGSSLVWLKRSPKKMAQHP